MQGRLPAARAAHPLTSTCSRAASVPQPGDVPERADFLDLRLERYTHDGLAPRIWALRASDATYVALGEAITDGGAPLLTADARLASRRGGSHRTTRVADRVKPG